MRTPLSRNERRELRAFFVASGHAALVAGRIVTGFAAYWRRTSGR